MADNVTLNTGSGGATLAADDISGVHHQRVKIEYGTDGSATDVSDSNPLPVDDAGGSLTVDNTTLSVTGGGVEASALRVTIASDSTGVVSVDDNGGSLTVDGTVAVSGTVAVTDNSGSLTVDNGGTFAVQESGAALTALQLIDNIVAAEDAVAGSGFAGVPMLVVRQDSHSDLAADGDFICPTVDADGGLRVSIVAGAGSGGTAMTDDAAFTPGTTSITPIGAILDNSGTDSVDEGDAGALRMSANRNLFVNIRDNAGNERGLNIDASGYLTSNINGTVAVGSLPASTNTIEVVGDAAHDAAVAGNPVLVGAEARTTNPTAVSNGDAVRVMADDVGRQVVVVGQVRDLVGRQYTAITSSTSETTIVTAGGSGVFNDLTLLTLSNESATECRVDIRDATGGSVLMSIDLAADGGGAVIPFNPPIPQATANNNWTAQCSASVASVYVTAVFVKNV